MKWSRELTIAKRSMETVLRAVSATMPNPPRVPRSFGKMPDLPDLGLLARSFTPTDDAAQPRDVADFGSNPGNLRMLTYAPRHGASTRAPLVVVLHGCGQHAADFARATGWTALADEVGFTLVMPEQNGRNHQGRCFQWFEPTHTARGAGEALSIRQMVAKGIQHFDADSKRVFVVGLSAGGAMAAALLAAYPDVFAGGAVVAGLPVGAASNTMQALMRMAGSGPEHAPGQWAEEVRSAVPGHNRRGWPPISIWHGTRDTVVDPANGDLLVTQWAAVHDLAVAPDTDKIERSARHRSWNAAGRPLMEQWILPEMAHGYPIDARLGVEGPYIINAGVSATREIARFWGLVGGRR